MNNRLIFRLWLPLGILLIGLISAYHVRTSVDHDNSDTIKETVKAELSQINNDILTAVGRYEYGVRGIRAAAETIGFEAFNYNEQLRYFQSREYAVEFPGARGFGLIKKVPQSNLTNFLQAANAERDKPFSLTQLDNPQDPLFIIQYIEPQAQNEQAIGLDIGSEALRRQAALTSATSKSTQLTAPITLVQASGAEQHGFLLLHPIFQTSHIQRSPELLGWAYAPLLINEILDTILPNSQNYKISISDVTATPQIDFYSTPTESITYRNEYKATNRIVVFGRDWSISLNPTQGFISALDLPNANIQAFRVIFLSILLIILIYILEGFLYQRVSKLRQRIAFASVVDNSSDGIIGVDSNFMITHWNNAANEIFDLKSNQAKNKPLLDWLAPGINTSDIINIFKSVSNGETKNNIPFKTHSTELESNHQLNLNISPIIAKNLFSGATINFHDVTEITMLQEELISKNKLFEQDSYLYEQCIEKQTIFESIIKFNSDIAFIGCDNSGTILVASRKTSAILNYQHDELVEPLNILDVIKLEVNADLDILSLEFPKLIEELNIPLHSTVTKRLDCFFKRKDSSLIKGRVDISSVADNGIITGYIFKLDDLEEISQKAMSHNQQTSSISSNGIQGSMIQSLSKISPQQIKNFTGNVYHEFRSPLTAINGYVDLIDQLNVDSVQQEYLNGLKQSVISLTRAIDEVLDLAFLDHGVLSLSTAGFELDELLNEVSSYLVSQVGQKQIEIHFDVDINVPYVLKSDKEKLKRILLHLGGNAVKYTEIGEVVFEISVLKSDLSSQIELQVVVRDTGIGIPAADLTHVFDVFMQVDSSEARRYRGLGVGLTIAKRYVELLDGHIEAKSTLGRGSEFTFTLRTETASNPQKLNRVTQLDSPIKVLIVDDNSTSVNILSSTLSQIGWTVTATNNSEEALPLISAAIEQGERYDLALIDWVMPGKDGWELGKTIKSTVADDDLPILIMATARSQSLFSDQFEKAPDIFNGCLTKPITRTQILDAYIDAVQTKTSPLFIETSAILGKSPLVGIRVLIVDDNPTNQLICKALLSSQGASVGLASSGKEAIRMLENELVAFNIVLMDIHMPGMDGFETAARIRQNPKFSQIPIVPMTTNLKHSDREKSKAVGMTGHIEKPFNLSKIKNEIITEISGKLDNKEQLLISEIEYVESTLDDLIIEFCNNHEIDIEKALERFNQLPEVYDRALTLFINDLDGYIAQLSSFDLSREDLVLIFHTLKGIASSLGFNRLAELAQNQEKELAEWVSGSQRSDAQLEVINDFNTAYDNAVSLKNMLTTTVVTDRDTSLDIDSDEFLMQFKLLKQEVASFNMHAIETFQSIIEPLKALSPEITDKMIGAINELKFKYAEELIQEVDHLIEGRNNGS
ncbi:response regulator [Reinekea sp.]|jgi:PAS domain S-box-containing protein|uniref:CHASE domain-containing hybrid sensor histidine kinase/response regulator n=1 Tax=Reinekea sp. TaxID=1970455 RepID=UPI003989C62E